MNKALNMKNKIIKIIDILYLFIIIIEGIRGGTRDLYFLSKKL